MKPRRWVKTQLLPRLGVRISYNYGSTAEHAMIELTVQDGVTVLGPPVMVSPKATRGEIRLSAIPQGLYEESSPEEVNRAIWQQLAGAYKAWRALLQKEGK